MNTQTARKQVGQTGGAKHLNRSEKIRKNEHVSNKAQARDAQTSMDLTNGDPPPLMLWGSDE